MMRSFVKKLSFLALFAFALFATTATNAFGLLEEGPGFEPDGLIENIPEDRSNIMIIGDYVFDLNADNHGYTVHNMIKAFQTVYKNEDTGTYEYYYHSPSLGAWQERVSGDALDESQIPYMNGDGTYRFWNMSPIEYDAKVESFDMTNEISLVFNHATMLEGTRLDQTTVEDELSFLKDLLVLSEEDEAFIDDYFDSDKIDIELSDNRVDITLEQDVVDPAAFAAFSFTYDELRFDLVVDYDKFTRYDGTPLSETPEDFKLLMALAEEEVVSTFKNFEQWEDSRIARVQSYLDDVAALDEVSMDYVEAIEYAREQYDLLAGSAADQDRIEEDTITALEAAEADMEFLVGLNELEQWQDYRTYLPDEQLDWIDEEELSDYAVLRDVWAMNEELGQFDTISEFDEIFDAAMAFRMSTRDAVSYANSLEEGDMLEYDSIVYDVVATLDGTALTHYHGNVSSETVEALNEMADEMQTYPESFLVERLAEGTYGGYSDVLHVIYDFLMTTHLAHDGDDLQALIDGASENDLVLVEEGTYEGGLSILTDGLTLKSVGNAEFTVLDASGATNAIAIGDFDKDGTHPTDVTIDGFKVVNWEERGIAQRNGTDTLHIHNNIVVGPEESSFVRGGIILSGGTGSTITGNEVTVGEAGIEDWSNAGIMLMGTMEAVVENNTIHGMASAGIGVYGYPDWESIDPSWVSAEDNLIQNNHIHDATSGVALAGAAYHTVIKNNVIEEIDRGINEYPQLGGTPEGTVVTENTFDGNAWGIRISSSLYNNDDYTVPMAIVGNAFANSDASHIRDYSQTLGLSEAMAENAFDDAMIVRNFIVTEAKAETLVLGYIEDAEENIELNAIVVEFAEYLAIEEDTLQKFDEMPFEQGRHQAIGNAMMASTDAFETKEDVKEYFEYFVDKEHAKYLYIQAVDGAESVEDMKDALIEHVPGLNETRQALIDAGVSELEGTNYTTTLYEINALIEEEHYGIVEDVAAYLYEERIEEGKFFGVVNIADALRDILDGHVVVVAEGESVQAAIDDAQEDATIYVHEGSYEENLTLNVKNLTLRSIVEHGALIKADEDKSAPAVSVEGEDLGDITVEGFVVHFVEVGGLGQGTGSAEGTAVHFLNNIVHAPDELRSHGNSIQVTGEGSTVSGNTVHLSHQPSETYGIAGILLVGATDSVVKDNTVIDPAGLETGIWIGGSGSGVVVTNNEVEGAKYGIRTGTGQTETTIEENTTKNNETGFVVGASDASIEQLFEDNTFIENHINILDHRDGWVSYMDFTTIVVYEIDLIEDALRAAKEDDTILVHEGTYEEELHIETDGLRLEAADPNEPTIIKGDLIRISGEGVTLEGFTLDGNGSSQVLEINGENVTVLNNLFKNATNTGIQLDIAGGLAHGVVIDNNVFDDTLERGVVGTENVQDITVTNNVFNVSVNGMGLGEGVSVKTISGNVFTDVNAMTIYEPTLDLDAILDNTMQNGSNGHFVFDLTNEVNLQTLIDNNEFTPDAYLLQEDGYQVATVKDNIDIYNETKNTGHYSLANAIDMSEANDTIALTDDVHVDSLIRISHDLTIVGEATITSASNVFEPQANVTLTLEDITLQGEGSGMAIDMVGSSTLYATNLTISDYITGIYVNPDGVLTVSESTFAEVTAAIGTDTATHNLNIYGNVFEASVVEAFGFTAPNDTLRNFEALKDEVVAENEGATEENINAYGDFQIAVNTDTGQGYLTIQEAIDEASEGDTIAVEPGEHMENLKVEHEGLTLLSDVTHEAILNGSIEILADDVHVEGFAINHGASTLNRERGISIHSATAGVRIENNILDGEEIATDAIFVSGEGTQILNNVIQNGSGAGNGLWTEPSGALEIRGNTITDYRSAMNVNSAGVPVYSGVIAIEENTFDPAERHGISIGSNDNISHYTFVIEQNTFTDGGDTSISDRHNETTTRDDAWREAILANNTVPEDELWYRTSDEPSRWFLAETPTVFNETRTITYDSAEEAVNDAEDGDVIRIQEGTYDFESVARFGFDLTIIGEEDVTFTSDGNSILEPQTGGLLTIENVRFEGSGTGIAIEQGRETTVDATQLSIENFTTGVYVNPDGVLTVSESTFAEVTAAIGTDTAAHNLNIYDNVFEASVVEAFGFTARNDTLRNFEALKDEVVAENEGATEENINAYGDFQIAVNTNTGEGYLTIQEAIDEASEGDTIAVEPGEHSEEILIETDGLILEAAVPSELTTIKGDLIRISGEGVTLEGFTLDGNGSSQVLEINGENVTVLNNLFKNATNTGIQLDIAGGLAHGVVIDNNVFDDTLERGVVGTENVQDMIITNNVFNVSHNAIGFGEGVSVTKVSGNTFNNTFSMTIYEPTLEVENIHDNTFVEGSDGWYVWDSTDETDIALLIEANTFASHEVYVLYDEDAKWIASEEAIDIFNETQGTGHHSIQSSLDMAEENDTIRIAEGTYEEDLLFETDGVKLIAETAHEATIHGHIVISADQIHIEGFTLEHEGEGRIMTLKETDGTIIHNNLFRNSERAIQAHLSPVTNLTVTENTFETEQGIMSTHNIYDIVLEGNTYLTESTGIRLSGNIEIAVIDIFDHNSFYVEDDCAVVDARDGEVEYCNDGFPQ